MTCLMRPKTLEGPGRKPPSFDIVAEHGSRQVTFPDPGLIACVNPQLGSPTLLTGTCRPPPQIWASPAIVCQVLQACSAHRLSSSKACSPDRPVSCSFCWELHTRACTRARTHTHTHTKAVSTVGPALLFCSCQVPSSCLEVFLWPSRDEASWV